MIYLILVIAILGIKDIKYLLSKNIKRDLYVYIALMLLDIALGIFYYSNPERDSFSKIVLSLIGKEG
ncbi:MAG TPA: hypothetical protein GXX37_04715 [Clostridiaceae bacterium]|nr:hypothetical protein [Clostridiaceae bacterium]